VGPIQGLHFKAADAWLSEYLDMECGLYRLDDARSLRAGRLAPVAGPADECRYHDGAPVSLLSEASLVDLNSKLLYKVDAGRFRPNVVFSGCEAYEECTWASLKVGAEQTPLRTLMDDWRCTMVTIEQREGPDCGTRPSGHETFMTLKAHRANNVTTHGPIGKGDPNFAIFAALDVASATLHVGDSVTVDATICKAKSIWQYNEMRSPDQFSLTPDNFWEYKGPKMVPLSRVDGVAQIAGKYLITGVADPVDLVIEGGAVKSVQHRFGREPMSGIVDQSDDEFTLDVQMGGFPMKAQLNKYGSSVVLVFSNGGKWTKQ